MEQIIFNGGQRKRYQKGEPPVIFKRRDVPPAEIVPVPPLEIHPKFQKYEYQVMFDTNEFIPGVTAKMVDWFWANMEKGYHLWAPGEHYGFDWIVAPCDVGYEGSKEGSYEFDPTSPIEITRISVEHYPFTECYEHCWIACFDDTKPEDGFLIHMYQDVEGGIYWRSVGVETEASIKAYMEKMEKQMKEEGASAAPRPDIPDHMAYESATLNLFLPQLYALWENHPDPWENMQYDLTTEKKEDGTWKHKYPNLPPKREDYE